MYSYLYEPFKMLTDILAVMFYLIILYIFTTYILHIIQLRNYPPGPFPIPLLGNLHQFGSDVPRVFLNLSKKYGKVFSFSFGMDRLVIVNGIDATREALITKGSRFAGRRYNNTALGMLSGGFKDIAFSDYGAYWTRARKLAHSALKVYGDGKGKLEAKVMTQYMNLKKRLEENGDRPVDLGLQLYLTVLNVICSKLFNTNYDILDAEFQQIMNFVKFQSQGFGSPTFWMQGVFPLLKYTSLECYRMFKRAVDIRDFVLNTRIEEHEKTFNPENIRDFTDSLLNTLKNDTTEEYPISRTEMGQIINDVFTAGFETTSTTMKWCMLYLLHWPQYQDMVYEEITTHLKGERRYPTLNDRSSLPITQAVIQETIRFSTAAYITVEHKSLEKDSIDGQPVPKDVGIFFNLWGLHNDEDVWDEPNVFNPSRWLDDNGKYWPSKHRSFLPFAAGRRVCLGESMAKTEIFTLVTAILRDFRIEPNLDEPYPSLEANIGFLRFANDFTVTLTQRD